MALNQLSPEEIERNQDAHRFKSDIVERPTCALWKLTDVRAKWRIHFEYSTTRTILPVKVRDSTINFEFSLGIYEEYELENFLFVFKPVDVPPTVTNLFGKCSMEILDKDGNVCYSHKRGPTDWLYTNDSMGAPLDDLYHSEIGLSPRTFLNDQVLGEEDSLTIRVTFTQMYSRTVEYPNVGLLQEKAAQAVDPIMASQMEVLLNDSSYADIHLKMKDGTVIHAHRLILCARSPVFKTMFEGNFTEKAGIAEIPDLSSATMKVLLHYVYTGKLHPDWKNDVGELLNGANKYDLLGLVQYCDHLMVTLCTDFNAEDLLAIAKLHSLQQATGEIEKYIRGITI